MRIFVGKGTGPLTCAPVLFTEFTIERAEVSINLLKDAIKENNDIEHKLRENIKRLYEEMRSTEEMKKRKELFKYIKSDMYVLYQHIFCDIIEDDEMFELFLI